MSLSERYHEARKRSGIDANKALNTQLKECAMFSAIIFDQGKEEGAKDFVRRFRERTRESTLRPTGEKMYLSHVSDIALLSREQFVRFLPDFVAWFNLIKDLEEIDAKSLTLEWIDNGSMGRIHPTPTSNESSHELL